MTGRDGGTAGPRPEEPERVIIRDNRKIDPVTGEVRTHGGGGAAAAASSATASAAASASASASSAPATELGQVPMVEASLLEERTHDLQRLQAEFTNYRRRAERERLAAGDAAVSRVLAELLPALDDIDRAREHDDLTGGLKAVADSLDSVFTKLGLVAFGEVGDPFDPAVHEAVLHGESNEVSEPTCTMVMRQGYKHNDRLLRPAMVGVTDPVAEVADPAPPITVAPGGDIVSDADDAMGNDDAAAGANGDSEKAGD